MRIKQSLSLVCMSMLILGQLSAHAFTPHIVENQSKVLLFWGDLNKNANNSATFNPTIAPNLHRIMAISGVNFESNDSIIERDSNNTGLVEIKSTITPNDVDGVLLLLNNNEDKLFLEFENLPDLTININSLKTQDFSFSQGNYSVVAKYIGNKFLQTPENPSTSNSFKDTPSSEWFFKYVQRIKDRKVDNQPIFEGYKNPDGSLTGIFSPAGEIKVGEMLKVVLRSAGHNETLSNLDASLIGSSHWSVGFQNKAIQLNLTIMDAVGIDPERTVSRGEFFQALVEALNLSTNCDTFGMSFRDLDPNNPYTDYACVLIRDGIISGTDSGFLNLFSPINRAEVAKILNTTLDTYLDQPQDVLNILNNLNLSTNTSGSNNQNNNNQNNSELSFVLSATTPSTNVGYVSEFVINFANKDNVRKDDLEVKLFFENTDITDQLTLNALSNDNSTLLLRKNIQWAVGNYKISLKDKTLNESKDISLQVLNCGEQFNPCGSFVGFTTVNNPKIAYTDNLNINLPSNRSDFLRQNDVEIKVFRNNQELPSNQVKAPTFNQDNTIISVGLTQQWATSNYKIIIKDKELDETKEHNITVLNCGEQFNPCPNNPSFIYESIINQSQIGYTSPLILSFLNPIPDKHLNANKTQLEDLEFYLSLDGQDVSNNFGSLTYNANNNTVTIYYKFQWPSGNYILRLRDTNTNQEIEHTFRALDTP